MVRLFPFSSMVPSTCPSMKRSSLPESSPLTITDRPMCAHSVAFEASMIESPYKAASGRKHAHWPLVLLAGCDKQRVCAFRSAKPSEIQQLPPAADYTVPRSRGQMPIAQGTRPYTVKLPFLPLLQGNRTTALAL